MAVACVAEIGKDFGGYVNIGTQGNLGSKMAETVGKCYGGWAKVFDATVTPFMLTWFGVTTMPNSYNMFMLQTNWNGIDYQPNANHVIVDVQGNAGTGWAYWINLNAVGGITLNDGNYHHILANYSGFSGGKPTMLKLWCDGVGYDMIASGTDFSDPGGLGGTCQDFTQGSYLACDGKTNAMTPIDMGNLNIEGLGIWDRALRDDEIINMYKAKGGYIPKYGLRSYYPFQTDGRNRGPNAVAAILTNNGGGSSTPTFTSARVTSKYRRKFL